MALSYALPSVFAAVAWHDWALFALSFLSECRRGCTIGREHQSLSKSKDDQLTISSTRSNRNPTKKVAVIAGLSGTSCASTNSSSVTRESNAAHPKDRAASRKAPFTPPNNVTPRTAPSCWSTRHSSARLPKSAVKEISPLPILICSLHFLERRINKSDRRLRNAFPKG
jgi:hypothetical protein